MRNGQTHLAIQSYESSDTFKYKYHKKLVDQTFVNDAEIVKNSDHESAFENWEYHGGNFDPLKALLFTATSVLRSDGIFHADLKDSHISRMTTKNVIILTISNTANLPPVTQNVRNGQIIQVRGLIIYFIKNPLRAQHKILITLKKGYFVI